MSVKSVRTREIAVLCLHCHVEGQFFDSLLWLNSEDFWV